MSESMAVDVPDWIPVEIKMDGNVIDRNVWNMRVITLRIANIGDVGILKSHFDDSSRWGFRTNHGRIVHWRVSGASSDYLYKTFSATSVEPNRLQFKPIIFDRGAYVALDVFVLHAKNQENQELRILPEGKIAGIDAFDLTRSRPSSGRIASAFGGDIIVQLLRLAGYGVVLLLIFIGTHRVATLKARRISRLRGDGASNDSA